jgi:hypothetical protein
MVDDPQREPFAAPLPPQPPTEEEVEAKRKAEMDAAAEREATPPLPPEPLTDEKVYPTPPTGDPRATHHAMSADELKDMGLDEDGNPVEEPPVEPEEPPPEVEGDE